MKWPILSFLLCFSLSGFTQDSTTVKLLVKGGEKYFVRIDGELQPQQPFVRVSKGSHQIEIWSFKHEIYSAKLETGNLDTTTYVAELRQSRDYNSYLVEREDYKRQLFFTRTGPVLLGSVSALAIPFAYFGRRNAHEELVKSRFYDEYGQTPASALDDAERSYAAINSLYWASVAGAVVGTGLYIALRSRAAALNEPTYKQQNPFTLDYMELGLNQQLNGPSLKLGITF